MKNINIFNLRELLISGVFILMSNYSFAQFGESPTIRQSIKSAFNPVTTEWDIEWPAKISQYDLVYKTPPVDPTQGIALGNGEVASLMWCDDSKIIIAVNKSDLWDDATFGRFHTWGEEQEDYHTTQRHASRIIIDFKFPIFNTLYLSDFNAKLSLADASVSIEAVTPFGKIDLETFIDHKSGILYYNLNSDLNEDVPIEITLERFGSRTFAHWYSQINRDASIGLSGTEAIADTDGVYITQKLSSGTFVVGGTVVQDNELKVDYFREHSRSLKMVLSGNRQKNALLAFSVTSPDDDDPIIKVKNTLTSVRDKGIEPFRQSHTAIWKSIWSRSFIDYGDDYLNNLWYLTMYYLNISQGGKFPGRFDAGLLGGWNRDVQNWNFYFHWNQQQLYWPLNAAGFPELIKPYLDFRYNSLTHAKKDAREFFYSDGAYISDVVDRRGYNSLGEKNNHTPVAEIAMDFWRQYKYTGDKKFLEEKALPFITEAARFFTSLLEKEDDGLYHAVEGSGYEGAIKLKDGLTELVYAKVLFTTALEAIKITANDIPEAKKWNDILNNLAPLPVVPANEELIVKKDTGFSINWGNYKGYPVATNEIFAAGWGIKENKWLTSYFKIDDPQYAFFWKNKPVPTVPVDRGRNGLQWFNGIFEAVPSSPVFPSGLIGLSQKGSKLFNAMTATALLYGKGVSLSYDMTPVVMARLGLTNELAGELNKSQASITGMGLLYMESDWIRKIKEDRESFFKTNLVRDTDVPEAEKFPLRMWSFRDINIQEPPVLATAMNESLLQSYEGILRLFPAFPASKNGRFTLHAEGGFVVSSEIKFGKVQWICIKSLLGNPCKLVLPWNKAVVQSNLKRNSEMICNNMTEIKTKANEVIMILPEGQNLGLWSIEREKPLLNDKVKYHSSRESQLGLPRMY